MRRRFKKVPKDKKTGVAKKYLAGSKDKSAAAQEIKSTAKAYKAGRKIDVKAISKFRSKDNAKSKATKRKRKKNSKRKS